MDNGYISIHRKIRDSFVWDKDNPKLLMAWLDILMMANWKPKQKVIKGKVVEIPRGSFVTSYVKLAERWGVHRDTAKRWMKLFETEKMVKIRSNNSYTYVTVENYDSYQTIGSYDTTAETSAEATQLNKDNKHISNIKDITSGSDEPHTNFQKVIDEWNKLPLQSIKRISTNSNRYKMLNARVKEYGVDDVLEAIRNVGNSSFLLGQNHKGWSATFDWVIRPNNFIKVLEGNYTDKLPNGEDSNFTMTEEEFMRLAEEE